MERKRERESGGGGDYKECAVYGSVWERKRLRHFDCTNTRTMAVIKLTKTHSHASSPQWLNTNYSSCKHHNVTHNIQYTCTWIK